MEGIAVWRLILKAIDDIERTEPKPGERVNCGVLPKNHY